MDAPNDSSDFDRALPPPRERRLIRIIIALFGAVLALGLWHCYGVLLDGIPAAYAR